MANTDVMTVIGAFAKQVLSAAVVAAIILTIIAVIKKEHKGYIPEKNTDGLIKQEDEKINYLYAIVPIIPLIMLITGSKQIALTPYVSVPIAMLIGTA